MTYHLEPLLTTIESPVVVKSAEWEYKFRNGAEAVEYEFNKHYRVVKMTAMENKIMVEIAEVERINEDVNLFDG